MRNIKNLAILLTALVGLASCNTDQEGAIYEPTGDNISLAQESQSFVTDASDYDVTVRFVRSNTKGAYTAHYTYQTTDATVLPDPNNGEVTFADGQGVAEITLQAKGMTKGVTYQANFALSDEDVATADTITKGQITEETVSILCDYEWEPAGTAEFTDFTFGDGSGSVPVPVEHAVTNNLKLYRLVAPYTALYGTAAEGGVDEANIQFTLNDDYSAKDLNGSGVLDWLPNSGYSIVWSPTRYAQYCNFTNDGNLFTLNFLLTDDGSSLYPGGQFTFEWTGWPGASAQ